MSLTSGLKSPRTPLRRFLDRELSAGPKPLRADFRARHVPDRVLMPPPGIGGEAGTIGTAIDQRLRLAFTAAAPVDDASLDGIAVAATMSDTLAGDRMGAVGAELVEHLEATVHALSLDDRRQDLERAHDEEQYLARMLLAAAWFAVAYRNWYGFTFTPLYEAAREDPAAFTLARLLQLPVQVLVDDVVDQVHHAAGGPLDFLRQASAPADCRGGPTFPGARISADADLLVDGLLLDFKSASRPHNLPQQTVWQLLGYLLLDTADRYRIDTVGLYLTRSARLVSWPVEDYLDLLGARRRELQELRRVFADLLAGCQADADPHVFGDNPAADRLVEELAAVIPAGHCHVCARPLPVGVARSWCSAWCHTRQATLRRRGWLPAQSAASVSVRP
ncbi:hypothetical protein [Streptomyces sp. RKAG293]|uniref:hypothetical protein n=1 Tax=Streptomyces sp. RKAG293 TaxID=2893403 RepID=UPI002034A557|nr:hypothetical protein [Streptomyces sp. RKAG293]MCM2424234.1 hypothetical protein [Streptomyces sp. RKAG293]